MKKLLSLVVACASIAVIPTTAMALPVGTTLGVSLDFGDATGTVAQPAGTWTFLPSIPVATTSSLGLWSCRYRAAWTSATVLPRTTNLFLDELQPVGENDCEFNQTAFLNTAIVLAPGASNYGFDPTQQRRAVTFALLSESIAGTTLSGIIVIGGVPYSLSLI